MKMPNNNNNNDRLLILLLLALVVAANFEASVLYPVKSVELVASSGS
jgi:hypothetical protein